MPTRKRYSGQLSSSSSTAYIVDFLLWMSASVSGYLVRFDCQGCLVLIYMIEISEVLLFGSAM